MPFTIVFWGMACLWGRKAAEWRWDELLPKINKVRGEARALGARGCPPRGQQMGDSKRAGRARPALRISHGERAGAPLAFARQ